MQFLSGYEQHSTKSKHSQANKQLNSLYYPTSKYIAELMKTLRQMEWSSEPRGKAKYPQLRTFKQMHQKHGAEHRQTLQGMVLSKLDIHMQKPDHDLSPGVQTNSKQMKDFNRRSKTMKQLRKKIQKYFRLFTFLFNAVLLTVSMKWTQHYYPSTDDG